MATPRKKKEDYLKTGRPTIYTEELGEKICEAVRNNVRGLSFICDQSKDFPEERTVLDWLYKNTFPSFSHLYAASKRFQAGKLADEMLEIAKTAEPFHRTGSVEKAKLQIDVLKWTAARLAPKKWSEKALGDDDVPVEKLTPEERKAKAKKILVDAATEAMKVAGN